MNSTNVRLKSPFAAALAALACLLIVWTIDAAEPISIEGLGDGIRH
jgi:hypothetical protein